MMLMMNGDVDALVLNGRVSIKQIMGGKGGEGHGVMKESFEATSDKITGTVASISMVNRKISVWGCCR